MVLKNGAQLNIYNGNNDMLAIGFDFVGKVAEGWKIRHHPKDRVNYLELSQG